MRRKSKNNSTSFIYPTFLGTRLAVGFLEIAIAISGNSGRSAISSNKLLVDRKGVSQRDIPFLSESRVFRLFDFAIFFAAPDKS